MTEIFFHLSQSHAGRNNRQEFVQQFLKELPTCRMIRFLVIKKHYNLIEMKQINSAEWEINIPGEMMYTYRFSEVVNFLEKIYDQYLDGAQVLPLNKEFQFTITRQTANIDPETGEPQQ